MSKRNTLSDRPPRIVVVGSINVDLVYACDALPVAGQTVSAHRLTQVGGGKGANQAVAAARAGGTVHLIGRVGDDPFADRLLADLAASGVDVTAVARTAHVPSGMAMIGVEASGENQIVVVPGANAELAPEDVDRHASLLQRADLLMLQLETPLATVRAAIERARRLKVRCMLDPAPVIAGWSDDLLEVDLVVPNESEATAITGIDTATEPGAMAAAVELQRRGARHAVITRGAQGAILRTGTRTESLAPHRVDAVDTTAAGDAFAGALAVGWSRTGDLGEAVEQATIAGALATTVAGAQPSLPTHEQICRASG